MRPFCNHTRVRLLIAVNSVILLATPSQSSGCDWTYYLNVRGHQIESGWDSVASFLRQLSSTSDRRDWEEARDKAKERARLTSDYKWQSDYAVALMHLGEAAKAVEILSDIEHTHPGEYVVAANLGTAYELSGDNDKAAEWIQEGMRRNAQAHHGTEWLHLLILNAKQALASDPEWLKTHSVLGLDFGSGAMPSQPDVVFTMSDGVERDLTDIQKAVTYQLHERLAFVTPPDPIVADLLFDLGNLLAFNEGVGFAASVYEMSLKFKPTRRELVARRRDFVSRLPKQPSTVTDGTAPSHEVNWRSLRRRGNWIPLALFAGSIGLLVISAVLKAWRRRQT
jgi:tetratricopeptide (TPR) repeat protein